MNLQGLTAAMIILTQKVRNKRSVNSATKYMTATLKKHTN